MFFPFLSSDSVTAFDEQSSSLIKLNNSTVLYLREVNKFLALVCILREYSYSRQGVIDFNFLCFRDAIHKVFEIRTTKKCTINDSIFEYQDGDEDVDEHESELEETSDDTDKSDSDDDSDDDSKRRVYIKRLKRPLHC